MSLRRSISHDISQVDKCLKGLAACILSVYNLVCTLHKGVLPRSVSSSENRVRPATQTRDSIEDHRICILKGEHGLQAAVVDNVGWCRMVLTDCRHSPGLNVER